MDNQIDFKDLWQRQPTSQPNMNGLQLKLRQFKKLSLLKLIITNILLLATSAFIIFIWFYYQPQLVSTKIGIVIIILAMVIYLLSYNKLFSTFYKIDSTQTNSDYLESLITIKIKQKYIQSTMLSLYFVLLLIGICLYMYEYTIRMTIVWAIFTYTISLAWISFSWFYLRPKSIKKQQTKIDELISKFETINNQLKEK